MPRIPKALAGGLNALLLTAGIGGAAYAQSAPAAKPNAGPRVDVQQRAQEFLNAFAAKLGKSPADVLGAFKSVEKDRVAQAVRDGKLTQQQADQANQRIDQAQGLPIGGHGFGPGPGHKGGPGAPGKPGGPGAPGKPGGPMGGPGLAADPAALAQFLGVQPADLRTGLQGKSLAQFAQEKGKGRDQLKAFLTQQAKTRLDQAVQAGRLTQAQEDQRLAQLNSQLDQVIDRVGPPAGRDGGRGPGGPGPRGGQGQPGAPAAPRA